jgi:hypothetical protein
MRRAKNKFAEELVEKGEKPVVGETYHTIFGKGNVVKDFLPAPEDLVLKEPETVKITMVLDKLSIDFFKREAKRLKSSYQRMIRSLLHEYASRHSKGL